MATTMASDACSLCGVQERPHRAAEAEGEVNHKFSPTGQLVQIDRRAAHTPPRTISTADAALRLALIDKGILSYDDLAAAEVRLYGRERVPERPSSHG